MRTIEQIQKDIKKKIKSGFKLKETKKIDKKVHFTDKKTVTDTEINEAINLEKKLQKIYKAEVEKNSNNEIEKQKAFEPITKCLKNVEEAVRKTDDDIRSFLVPVRPLTQTSDFLTMQQKMIKERDSDKENTSGFSTVSLGPIASGYVNTPGDNVFGLYYKLFGYLYVLNVIDTFSKFALAQPL